MRRALVAGLLIASIAVAQSPTDDLRSKVTSVRYPPLAQAALIEGDVHMILKSGEVTLISGPPLLVRTAPESAKSFGPVRGGVEVDVIYHFVFAKPTTPMPVMVKRGNALERGILRMLGIKTEKILYWCGEPPANDLKTSEARIEVWIYTSRNCYATTESSTLIARR